MADVNPAADHKSGTPQTSHLFLLRVWQDETTNDDSAPACHGRIQHVLSGEAYSFEGMSALTELLATMLPAKPKG